MKFWMLGAPLPLSPRFLGGQPLQASGKLFLGRTSYLALLKHPAAIFAITARPTLIAVALVACQGPLLPLKDLCRTEHVSVSWWLEQ